MEGPGDEATICRASEGEAFAVKLHYLPFFVGYEGSAPVQQYFIPEGGPTETLRASFRGRLLQGKTLSIPEGYDGVILQQGRSTGSGQKKWTVAGRFNEWVYWNHDTPPQAGDLPQQWMEWPLLAKQLHQQVTEDEISSLAKDRS